MARMYAVVERDSVAEEDGSDSDTELSALGAAGGSRGPAPRPPGMGERHAIMVCFFFGGMILYAQRAGMAVGIVRMQSIYNWDKELQGMILSAFFLGYAVLQIPAGYIAVRFGGVRCITASVLGASLLSLLVPAAVNYSPYALFLVRVGQGLLQAPFYSAAFAMWSHWAPPVERSRLSAQAQIGGYAGTLIFGGLAGWQCDQPELFIIGGWEGVFYLHGLMGIVWFLVWLRVGRERPATSHRCSAAERKYIEDALLVELERLRRSDEAAAAAAAGGEDAEKASDGGSEGERAEEILVGRKLIWVILTSPAVIAMCVAHTAADWGSYILQDGLPGYLRDVLDFSLTEAGLFASMPTLLVLATSSGSAHIADWLRQGRMSTGAVRKMFSSFAFVPASTMLLALGECDMLWHWLLAHSSLLRLNLKYTHHVSDLGIIMIGLGVVNKPDSVLIALVLISGVKGCNAGGGYQLNALDISPQLAGFTHGVMNMCGQATGWLAPIVLGYMTRYPVITHTQEEPAGVGPAGGGLDFVPPPDGDTGGTSDSLAFVPAMEDDTDSLAFVPAAAAGGGGGGGEDDASGLSREQWMTLRGSAPPASWVDEMRAEWRVVFVMAAAIDICGLLVFLRFGSGDRQWWDAKGRM
jgi:hypothetical protein